MTSRGLEQEFGELYVSEPGDSQRPPSGYSSHHRLGPSPFKNGYGSVNHNYGHAHPPPQYPRPSHPDYDNTPHPATRDGHAPFGHQSLYRMPPDSGYGDGGYHGNPQQSVSHPHRRHPQNHPHARTDYASPVTMGGGGGTRQQPKVLLRLRLKGGGGGTVLNISDIDTNEGLPSFKPVIYKNPADDESDEDDDEEELSYKGGGTGARVSQTQGYYGQPQYSTQYSRSQPVGNLVSQSQQVRLHRIPVQHISSSMKYTPDNEGNRYSPIQQMASSTRYTPNTSQSGVVYSGVASSVPMGDRHPPSHSHHLEENDYVNASAIANLNNEYYNEEEEEEFIPPAVPAQVSYGSVATHPHTPHIKGPDYRIAPDVPPDQRPPYVSPSPSFQGHQGHSQYPGQGQIQGHVMPEPVSSKLMYTAPVAPAGRGFVQSHHKNAPPPPHGGPPPPTYDQPAYSKQKDGPMSYAASYSSPQQGAARAGLYNYSDHQQMPMGGEHPGGGEKKQEEEVDALTQMLMQNMEAAADPDFFGICAGCGAGVRGVYNACLALGHIYHISCFSCYPCGMCARCGRSIMGENTGCSALDQLYHIDCFTCIACGQCLGGQPFFAMEGKPYCEPCYMSTLEKCSVCSKPITDRILRATGKPYHPGCFTCVVCGKSLDGVPFTVDATNQIHCIEDFHKKFAPRCCVCGDPIMPEAGNEETVRIVAMDRSFHVKCYKCEDCGMVLSSEAEGRGCYPLDDHILCKNCNASRIQTLTTKMTTEL